MKMLVRGVWALVGLSLLAGCGSDEGHEGRLLPQPDGAPSPPGTPSASSSPQQGPAKVASPAASLLKPQPLASAVQKPTQGFQAGEMIVKYRADGAHGVTRDVEQWLAEGRSFKQATADASPTLDALHRGLGVKSASSLLPGRYGLATSDAQTLFSTRSVGVAKTRASLGLAAPTRSLAELANVYVVKLEPDADVLAAVETALRDPHVEYAQPNYLVKAHVTPNDPYLASSGSWGQPYDDLWALKLIHAPAAWDVTQGDGVVVAVVDSGLDLTHPDIAANVWQNPGEIPGNGIDDDGNGFVDDVHGWAFDANSPDPTDFIGHGTHVSGTIAAVGDNSVGIVGVAPRAKLMPVRGFSPYDFALTSWLTQGIVYAAQNGARVINNSWGCDAPCPSDPVVEEAVDLAVSLGATVVFSAGNEHADIKDFSPQNRPNVLVVAASDPADQPAFFSNFGALDVAAPGTGPVDGPPDFEPFRAILSLKSATCFVDVCPPELIVGGQYLRQAGTSMAAPQVAGLAALILAQHPEYEPEQVRQVIRRSAVDTGAPGIDVESGYGRIDAAAALAEPAPLTVDITGPLEVVSGPGALPVTGTASGPDFASYRLEFGETTEPTSYTLIASSTTAVTAGALGSWDTSTLGDGTHTLRLQATTTSGVVYEDRQAVTFDRAFISAPAASYYTSTIIYGAGEAVVVRGSAASGGFASYGLSVTRDDGSVVPDVHITLPNGGHAPVLDDVLGTWDTTGMTADAYTIVLTVERVSGAPDTASVRVVVDPTLHPGFPVDLYAFPNNTSYTNLYDQLTAVDLDGDGASEIACTHGQFITFFNSDGEELPGWPQSVDPDNYGAYTNQAPVIADVTGDGVPEVLATNYNNKVFIWNTHGELLLDPVDANTRFIAVDDMDGDGRNEIVTTSWAGTVNIWRLEGQELVKEYEQVLTDFQYYQLISPPALGDMDGDGKKEIAVLTVDYYVSLFGLAKLWVLGADGPLPGWPIEIDDGEHLNGGVSYPVLGDIDGDGQLDLVAGANSSKVFAFHADGRAVPGWPQDALANAGVNTAALGDFDGDGRLDVVVGTDPELLASYEYGSASLFAWHGDGRLFDGFPRGADYATVGYPNFGFGAPALADIDGDGEVEAIATEDGGFDPFRSLAAVNADGSTVPGFPKMTAGRGPFSGNTSAIADFDGDGQLELAYVDFSGLLYLWDLDADASGPRPWPMYQHDPQHTARADAPTVSGFRARLRSGQGSPSDERIEPEIRLLNDTASDVALATLTVRYWYTDETAPSPQLFTLTSAENEGSGAAIPMRRVTSRFGTASGKQADRYVEVGFSVAAGKVASGSSVALAFTVRAESGASYDERNDYSWRRIRREGNSLRVTVYRNGELVWGVEP